MKEQPFYVYLIADGKGYRIQRTADNRFIEEAHFNTHDAAKREMKKRLAFYNSMPAQQEVAA